jgi:hypothetical protein
MAGAGAKTWSTGDVLTASDVNTYLMQQSIMVFATETTRDAALTSPSDGMFAYTTTTPADTLSYYNGSAWVAVDLAGDITGITTASNSSLAGGTTSGTATLTVDVNNSTSATATTSDYMLISDTDDSNATKKALISDVVSAGDITEVTTAAASGLQGGATSGAVALSVNFAGLTAAQAWGSDGSGIDMTWYSDTAGDSMVWDSSAEALTITGTDGQDALAIADGNLSVTDTATIGTLTLDSAPATAWTDANIVLAGQVFSG